MNDRNSYGNIFTQADGVLLTGEANRRYASGCGIAEGIVLLCEAEAFYFTDSRYLEAAQNALSGFTVLEADREHPYSSRINEAISAHGIGTLGFEEEDLSHGAFLRFREKLKAELVPMQKQINAPRAAKKPWELERMRQAQRITDKTFSELLSVIRPGMTEKELEAELIYRLSRNGSEKPSFDPIVVSGENTSLPHGVAGERVLRNGDFVTMDFGAKLDGYCADMTRTVALGSVTDEMREVYQTVLAAQQAGLAATKAGVSGKQMDAAARDVIGRAGYGAYFGHSYGHSLGLEIHESPNASPGSEEPMPAGAVVSAEPGIYLPGKFGVRIEDVTVILPDGIENLTHSPKNLIIL